MNLGPISIFRLLVLSCAFFCLRFFNHSIFCLLLSLLCPLAALLSSFLFSSSYFFFLWPTGLTSSPPSERGTLYSSLKSLFFLATLLSCWASHRPPSKSNFSIIAFNVSVNHSIVVYLFSLYNFCQSKRYKKKSLLYVLFLCPFFVYCSVILSLPSS